MNIYSGVMHLRNYLYKKNILKSFKLDCPVVSVGNISVGGTGKTAVVDHLLTQLQSEGIKVGVVSRGYKGKYKHTSEVNLKTAHASYKFGDEVCMIKWKHPDVPIYVGKKRYNAGAELLKKYPETQLILADDAFQHLSLSRDLNICLLDVTESSSNIKVLPFGRMREDFKSAIKRADVVLLTKANLATAKSFEDWQNTLSALNVNTPTYKVNFYNNKFINLQTKEQKSQLQGRAVAFCGLAKPKVFIKALTDNPAINLIEALAYKDHMSYNKKHIKSLLRVKKELKADYFVTTAKDAIKLLKYTELTPSTWMADLELEVLGVSNYEADFIKKITGNIWS